jgi:hypothetical protein
VNLTGCVFRVPPVPDLLREGPAGTLSHIYHWSFSSSLVGEQPTTLTMIPMVADNYHGPVARPSLKRAGQARAVRELPSGYAVSANTGPERCGSPRLASMPCRGEI